MSEKYTFNSHAPECPYCGREQDHDGDAFYDESLTECECERCGKTFDFEVYTSTNWTCTARPDQKEPSQ